MSIVHRMVEGALQHPEFLVHVDFLAFLRRITSLVAKGIPGPINNVNVATNSQFFSKYNGVGDSLPYGGETKPLRFTAPVNAGQVNTMVIGIADALDHALDLAVFNPSGLFEHGSPAGGS